MPHPADRQHRRLLNRKHKPYDGDRHLIRHMQQAMDAMRAADQAAVDAEWTCLDQLTPRAWALAMQAGRHLNNL